MPFEATGHFRTMEKDGTWWLVDPEGPVAIRLGYAAKLVPWAVEIPHTEIQLLQIGADHHPLLTTRVIKLAELQSHAVMLRTFIDRCLELHIEGQLSAEDAAMAKLHATEMLAMVTDEAIQIFGGMGLMDDFPIERFWRDARVERIWDGTSEIQRHIISRDLLRPLGA